MAMERAGSDELQLRPPPAEGLAASMEQELLYRVELQQQQGADRRKRRAMKNRESAERSRARKQAYMHELEQEVRLLRAEVDSLRHECHQLKAAAAAEEARTEAPAAKRAPSPALRRVSSATF